MAERADRAATSGLAVGAGLGTSNDHLGGHLAYYLQTRAPRVRLAIHAGAGAGILLGMRSFAATAGSFLAYGRRHRFVVDLSGGALEAETLTVHGARVGTKPLYGASLVLGWEWMNRVGFYLRAGVGPGLTVRSPQALRARRAHIIVTGSLLSLGMKLW